MRGGGNLGEGLFDAGTGARAIRSVLEGLKLEADELFKPRGTTTKLQVALRALRERQKQRKEAMLSPQTFVEQRRALTEAQQARDAAAAKRLALLKEHSRITRALAVQPLLARRDALESERASLGEAPHALTGDAERRDALESALRHSEREQARVREELGELTRALAALPAAPAQIMGDELVSELQRRFGLYLRARANLPGSGAQLALLQREVAALSERLGDAASGSERLDTPARARLRKLHERALELAREQRELVRRHDEQAFELSELARQVSELGSEREVTALEQLVAAIERDERAFASARLAGELASKGELVATRLAALGTKVTLAQLGSLSLPSEPELEELEHEEGALELERRELEQSARGLTRRTEQVAEQRAQLYADGEVVTEQALEAARSERELAFRPLAEAASMQTLLSLECVQGFADKLRRADELADRLRREASRASTLSRLELEAASIAREEQALGTRREALGARRVALSTRFSALLGPLGLRSERLKPARQALRTLVELAERARELEALRSEHAEAERHQATLAAALKRALGAVHEGSLLELLASAKAELHERKVHNAELRAQVVRHAELASAHAHTRHELERLTRERAELDERLARELSQLGFPAELSLDEVQASVEELSTLKAKQSESEALRARCALLEQESQSFRAELRAACEQFVPEALALEPDVALALVVSTQRARHDAARERARLAAECKQREELAARLMREHTALLDEQKTLFETTGLHSFDELRAAERRGKRLGELATSAAALDAQLAEASGGASLEALRATLRELQPDVARSELADMESELERVGEELDAHSQSIGRLQGGMEELERASGAVTLAEETQNELASLRHLARHYAELRLALAILQREVERYRARHQGPVLARASELFPRLTLGRYKALDVELGDKDEPVLCCIRADDKRVRVEGLSDGTRDQLYLALRIASIERYVEHNGPMPLVLDDAFVHFDDARSAAALAVLDELAQRTQVIFFTHHARMLDLCRATVPATRLLVHELDPARGNITTRDDGPLFARM